VSISLQSNSLYELTDGALPESVSRALKKVAGFKTLISIPQIHNGKLYGETTLAFSKNQPLPSEELVKSFSNILAVSLRNSINESQLKISEGKYRMLVENTHSIAWEYDILSDRWIYVAPQCLSILGYEPEEWTDLEFWTSRLHPEDREWASLYCIECTAKGVDHTFEYRFRKKDDDFAWLRDIVSVEMKDDKPLKLRGLIIDITERKQLELELAESAERFKALHNASFGGIAIHNKGLILECNQGLSDMMGYSLDELIGMDGLLLVVPDHRDMVKHKIVSGYGKSYEANGLRKNGEQFPIRIEARTVPYKGESVRSVEFRDITEAKQAEDALRKSEKHTRLLNTFLSEMLELPDAKSIYDYLAKSLQHIIDESIVLCVSVDEDKNETVLESIAGIDNSFIGKISKLAGFNPIGKRYELKKMHLEYFRKGCLVEFEGKLADFSSNQFPTKIAGIIEKLINLNGIHTMGVKKGGKVLAAIHIFTRNANTITDSQFISSCVQQAALVLQKKMAEEKLSRSEQSLRLMNDEKNAFFQILAHDLRSPLGAIVGTFDLLREKHNTYSPEKRQLIIDQLSTLATNTFNLLDDLLLWSNSQAGNLSFNPQKVNLGSVTSDLIESINPLAASKKITIDISIANSIVVLADKNMLSVILRNLVVNAIKFTSNGGHINIESTIKGDKLIVSVSDNGVGMEQSVIDSIFKLSKKITTSGTNNELGTGFGLKLCKEFVEKHGGKIWAESEVGKGSVFNFLLTLENENA
jgi:PAS domain S-box-containing protein